LPIPAEPGRHPGLKIAWPILGNDARGHRQLLDIARQPSIQASTATPEKTSSDQHCQDCDNMKTLIRVTEIWVPNQQRTHLEFFDGLYGKQADFKGASETMSFAYDEGLPGKAWAARRPVILHSFENSYFLRTEAAKQAGLTAGIALPIFAGDYLQAVIVFFIGDDADNVGGIEIWSNTPAESFDMGIDDGYYGTAETFEWTARHTKFRPGFGLPGTVWQSGMPCIMQGLLNSKRTLRQDSDVKIGINKGVGIPCAYDSKQAIVMTFLSALGTPIARRFEIWVPNEDGSGLHFGAGDCDQMPHLSECHHGATIAPWEGAIGEAWKKGVPAVRGSLVLEPGPAARAATAAGLSSMVVVPVIQEGRFKAAVAWYF
jgi:hypothetical protein